MLDQVLASASNFVVVIIAAKTLSPPGFGSFAIAMEVYFVAAFISRGLASDPLAVAHVSDSDEGLRWAIRSGAATVVFSAGALAVVVAATATLLDGDLRRILLVLAVLLPGLALQDFLRYALIVRGQASRTFVNDLFWFVLQVPFLLVAIRLDGGVATLLFAWGVVGNLAALLGLVQARTHLGGLGEARTWLRRHRTLWPYFLLDNMVVRGTILVLLVVITAATTLAQVAGFRAAMTVYAPLTILGRGILGVAVPELARRADRPRAIQRGALVLSWAMAPLALAWAALTLLIPDEVGRAFLGASWEEARPLVFLAGINTAAGLFASGTAVGLRALGAGREGLSARVVVSVLALVASAVGGLAGGAYGVFVVLALSAPLQVATWWWLLVVAARARAQAASAALGDRHPVPPAAAGGG
jgi:O-antigen/teichoic acid export membrane protein